MIQILLAFVLQSPPPPSQSVELPVSLENIRTGLEKPPRFEPPPPRPWRVPVFRTSVEKESVLEGEPWAETRMTPPWMRTPAPPVHFEFLEQVVPEEFRAATLYPCCNITSAITSAAGFVKDGVRKIKEGRAKREVEEAMRAAGIKR